MGNEKEGGEKNATQDAFNPEILRQLVHLSGLVFIALAWFIEKSLVGILFIFYSEYVCRRDRGQKTMLSRIECRLRDFAFIFERKDARRPFAGAFWFYFGAGLAFLVFPLNAASAAGATLAVSDSLSTIIGKKLGRHAILGRKTVEGTAAFFLSSLFICLLFFSPAIAVAGAAAAALAELLPEWNRISRSRLSGLLDDNLLIPLMTGLTITLAVMI
jgi:dolichol kinase